jgi:hypothetical protein
MECGACAQPGCGLRLIHNSDLDQRQGNCGLLWHLILLKASGVGG